jgi:opacity protein-like surface antigen
MVHALRSILMAGAAMALLVQPGFAADLDMPIFVEQAPEVVPVEIGNGWYIRGDVGYAVTSSSGPFHYRTFDPNTGAYGNSDFLTGDMSQDFSGGIGAGYQFNQWFRGDVTLDWFGGDFEGTTAANSPCLPTDPALVGTTCRTIDRQDYFATTAMVNGYVDLGTFVGLTPYIGAGAGYTWMDWGTLTNTLICVDGTTVCPTDNIIGDTEHKGVGEGRFTYALMAGASYDLSHNLKLDMGYKYTKVESGGMFEFDGDSKDAGAIGVQGTDSGFDRHDVRLGLRYSLW